MELVRNAYSQAKNYPDFFDAFLWNLFPDDGLIIIRPEDEYVRQAAVPVINTEIENPQLAANEIENLGLKLQEYGLTPQIHKREGRTSFFLINSEQRLTLDFSTGKFIDAAGERYSKQELKDKLFREPTKFSPSAILRPVIQDAVFPTAASILGPSEMAYHFLLKELYARHNIARPAAVPRIGFTIVEPKEQKLLKKYNLSPLDMPYDSAYLAKQIVRHNRKESINRKQEHVFLELDTLFNELQNSASSIDPTIEPIFIKYQHRIKKILNQSEELLVRRDAQKNEQVLLHLYQLQDALYPNGGPQERTHSVLHYLLNYGLGIIDELKDEASNLPPGEHPFVLVE